MQSFRRSVTNPKELAALYVELGNIVQPFDVVISRDKTRTDRQNRTIHLWFKQIAQQRGDMTEAEVKAECNLTYGKPILARDDDEWASAFGYIFDSLSHLAKLKALRVFDIPITRRMNVKQLSEYIDQMQKDYREAGFNLVDPEMRKWEDGQ